MTFFHKKRFKSPNSVKQNQNDYVKKQLGSAVSKRIIQQTNKPADYNINSEPFMMNTAPGPNLINGNSPSNQGQFMPNQMDMNTINNNNGASNYANQLPSNIYNQPNAPNTTFNRTLSPSLNNGEHWS